MPNTKLNAPLNLSKEGLIVARDDTPARPAAHPAKRDTQRVLTSTPEANLPRPPLLLVKSPSRKPTPAPARVPHLERVIEDIRSYEGQGRATEETFVDGILYFTNAFWRANGGGSQPIQKAPYHACYSGNLAEFFIERLSKPGAIVHDPFSGRGTTAIQSALMGRTAYCTDVNPLSVMMARPRLSQTKFEEIVSGVNNLELVRKPVENEDLLAFYHSSTLQDIEALRRILAERAPADEMHPDPILDWIRMAVIFRISGHTAAYLSRKTLPPNAPTRTLAEQRRKNEITGLPAPERDLRKIILDRSKSLLRQGCVPANAGHRLAVGAAWDTPWIADASVDMVLMSPPFANVVDYAKDNWLRGWFAEITLENVAFSHHASLTDWTAMIRRNLIEQMRVVKPGGYISVEVGEIRNGRVALERLVWEAAEGLPCRRIAVVMNRQIFTKSAHTQGVTNGVKGTNSNRIVIMQRT